MGPKPREKSAPISSRRDPKSTALQPRPTKTSRSTKPARIHEDTYELSKKNQLLLATEIINSALRLLSESAKPSVKRASTGQTKSSHANPPLSPKKVANTRIKPSVTGAKKTISPSAEKGQNAVAQRVVAECAHAAFAYLEKHISSVDGSKDLPALQYENGMISFIGKLISARLDPIALKELHVLKRRLDSSPVRITVASTSGRPSGPRGSKQTSLVSLLTAPTTPPEPGLLNILISHQLLVLKAIANRGDPAEIRASLQHLRAESKSCLQTLLLEQVRNPKFGAKAFKQLDTLAQTILSMCPSISSSEDSTVADRKRYPDPVTVLELQTLALHTRLRKGTLGKLDPSIFDEVLESFSRCLNAYVRRCQASPEKKYTYAKECYQLLSNDIDDKAADLNDGIVQSIKRTLCGEARSAKLLDETLRWTAGTSSSLADTNDVVSLIRSATVHLDCGQVDPTTLDSATKLLANDVGPCLPRTEIVLAEVAGFRKAATKLLWDTSAASKSKQEEPVSVDTGLLCRAIFSSVQFFADYTVSREEKQSRSSLSTRITKAFIDSALVACRIGVSGPICFDELDLTLSRCVSIIGSAMQRNVDQPWPPSLTLISNIYWTSFLKSRSGDSLSPTALNALRRSVNVLKSHTDVARQDELFPLKLVTLSKILLNEGEIDKSADNAIAALRGCIANGLLNRAMKLAAIKPLREIFDRGGPLELPGSCCRSFLQSSALPRKSRIAEVVNMSLDLGPGERGSLLEYLLSVACNKVGLSKQTGMIQQLEDIEALGNALLEIYTDSEFPLRRRRVDTLIRRATSHTGSTFSQALLDLCKGNSIGPVNQLARDEGLVRYQLDITATAIMVGCLQTHPVNFDRAHEAIALWLSLTDGMAGEPDPGQFLNDPEATIGTLQSSSDMFVLHGQYELQVQCLRSLVVILNAAGSSKRNQLLKAYVSLSQAYLSIGRTSDAGMVFSKSHKLVDSSHIDTETKLHWNLAYGQYLLALGNIEKCRESFSAAGNLFEGGKFFQALAEPTASLSERMRISRVLVEACCLQSQLDAMDGSFESALCCARRCITLDRRTWATLETRQNETNDISSLGRLKASEGATSELSDITAPDSDSDAASRHPKSPLIMSMTHNRLKGPAFWRLIPPMIRSICQYSQLLATQGIYQDALYWTDQAYKVAAAISSAYLKHNILAQKARLLLDSTRLEEAAECINEMKGLHPNMPDSVHSVQVHLTGAGLALALADIERATESVDKASDMLNNYAEKSLAWITKQQHLSPGSDLVSEMEQLTLNNSSTSKRKGIKPGIKKAQTKAPPSKKSAVKRGTRSVQPTPKDAYDDANLLIANEQVAIFKAYCNVKVGDIDQALRELDSLETTFPAIASRIEYQMARIHILESQAIDELSRDVSLSVLPESSISYPSWTQLESSVADLADLHISPEPRQTRSSPRKRQPGRPAAKSSPAKGLLMSLKSVRSVAMDIMRRGLKTSSLHNGFQVCNTVAHLTMLLSVSACSDMDAMHPLLAAFSLDIPRINAAKREQSYVRAEARDSHRTALLTWPQETTLSDPHSWLSIASFQNDYVDIIPSQWSVISLNLNDAQDELYVVKYEAGRSPFTVRLPMVRHNSRDQDEDVFSFESGKAELEEIIEQSNWSAHNVPENGSKAEKKEWWAERESLDARLRDLLLNIENIWLGGFKGILSQHSRDGRQMALFQRNFEKILNRHLPSRKGRGAPKKFNFDARVLDLFAGLGNPDGPGVDLDEHLLDLLYFVVDILQFNGETNAYDEVDFDSICVETIEALQAYHAGLENQSWDQTHTILILDKKLLPFPWECLPCLVGRPVSRLTSLDALRSRILSMTDPRDSEHDIDSYPGHHVSLSTGTSILNPSGDLRGTEASLKPFLSTLPLGWTHHATLPEPSPSHTSSDTALTRILQDTSLLLYFGHGSTSQYARGRAVRSLPSCPTTWLMGCSSGGVTDNGQLEPHGMILSYLGAGAPAIVGALWDVTDRDTDRFSVRMGSEWGLWEEPEDWEGERGRRGKRGGKERLEKAMRTVGTVKKRVNEIQGSEDTVSGGNAGDAKDQPRSLVEAVAKGREACYLKYLNGAAMVVYGIPVYLSR
ncbi:hypothetical protein P152DRAFT_390951 [Eremomyces bilateralis CBS 781.70]|uniref:separase n=1 Tax=Eremomyces bilateralis CBS 781.70 TaxID=1392243 RepID=A0A6G1GBU4_9PEZI|nr:uncharacterized protein P152DRAFT_390951 [Eremomyces bilateralis CBS 781.70]KAF1815416.1 hypothetical protein P152DRAFT_390951 [Eremomyces bilateralis CBS 781.70]